jgi:ferredoxin
MEYMFHRQKGYRFPEDWTEDELSDIKRDEGLTITRIVPVNIEVKGEHKVLNLDEAKGYLKKAKEICLVNCGCRTAQHHCDAPLDVCMGWDSALRVLEGNRELNPRTITLEEAIKTLERSHEAGLVHMAYSLHDDKVNAICSCCSCCCAVLSSVTRFGLPLHLLTSDTISKTDLENCDSCGVCVDRCQFGARQIVDGSLKFDPGRCLGCGLCVTKCPTGAIELARKER